MTAEGADECQAQTQTSRKPTEKPNMTGDALRLHTLHSWTTDAAAQFTARWPAQHAQELADVQCRVTRRFYGRNS